MTHLFFSLLLGVVAIFFVVVTIILLYHWHRYAPRRWVAVLAELIYLVVAVILLIIALGAFLNLFN